MTALGNKIRATCVIKEKTMRSLSEALKMSHQCLYARLNDDDLWKLSELEVVASFLGESIGFFLESYRRQTANSKGEN